jgi:hypothetical protein
MKIDSFIEKKSQNQEAIVIKKKSKKNKMLSESSEVVRENEIDP